MKSSAVFCSQRPAMFGGTPEEVEEAWQELDEEDEFYRDQEKIWREGLPSPKERAEGFIKDGSITEEGAENARRAYLQNQYEKLIRVYLETKTEPPQELRKIFSEYNSRFEGGEGITPEMIETAHNYPIDQLTEVKRGFASCPFHAEKTPSLHITGNKYYCHGCSEGGDAIKFVMKRDNLSFKEAIKYLTSL